MPLYTISCPDDMLSNDARARLAQSITAYHCRTAKLPADWVHIIFNQFARGCGFSAGKVADVVSLTLVIRDGRSPDYKRAMLRDLWKMVQDETCAPDDQIVIGIQEVPASQAMEMGAIMPDVPRE